MKRWPKEKFAALISQLMNIQANGSTVKIVIPGSLPDVPLANEIIALAGCRPLILAGKTNLRQLCAFMRRANLVISADSGPLHIASSVGAKTIALFGPTRPEVTGPRGNNTTVILHHEVGCNRASCYYLDCPSNICMQAITVEEVAAEVKKILATEVR